MKHLETLNNMQKVLKNLKIKLILISTQLILLAIVIAVFGRLDPIALPTIMCIGIALILQGIFMKEFVALRDKILIFKERNNVLSRAKIETKDIGED